MGHFLVIQSAVDTHICVGRAPLALPSPLYTGSLAFLARLPDELSPERDGGTDVFWFEHACCGQCAKRVV